MSKFDEQRHSATIFMVNETETGALQLIGSTTDTDEAVVLTINSKKFDAVNLLEPKVGLQLKLTLKLKLIATKGLKLKKFT